MRRIILLLSVVAVMAAMMAVSAIPAFAQGRPTFAKPPPDACLKLEQTPEQAQFNSGCVTN